MKDSCRSLLTALPLCLALAFAYSVQAQTAQTNPPASKAPPPVTTPSATATYPQIARIRSLEGDVRIARGKDAEKQSGALWEQATPGLPLASGASLSTGAGRVEIELEDASTVYLADNSLLTLDNLETKGGSPQSEMTLLSGTATLHVHPVTGGFFALKTPTDGLTTSYPAKAYLRVTSYSDAVAITPQKDESYQLDGATASNQTFSKGQTEYYSGGRAIPPPAAGNAVDLSSWDAWVSSRVNARATAMNAAMKASGLKTAQPGLADMAGQGTFFPCAPYGTCWDPPGDPDRPQTTGQPTPTANQSDFALALNAQQLAGAPGNTFSVQLSIAAVNGFSTPVDVEPSLPDGFSCSSCNGLVAPGQSPKMQIATASTLADGAYVIPFTATAGALVHEIDLVVYIQAGGAPSDFSGAALPLVVVSSFYPCFPGGIHLFASDAIPIARHTYLVQTGEPYAWTVCHLGSWIYRQNHYVWVVGPRRHHHPPYRWVKSKHFTGIVPVHPRDVAGKPPVNRKHDAYSVGKPSEPVQRVQLDQKQKIEELKSPPKEFRKPYLEPLARAEEPHPEAHAILAPKVAIPLMLDAHSHNFVMAKDVTNGGENRRTFEPIAPHNGSLRTGNNNSVIPRIKTGAPSMPKTPHTPSGTGHTSGGAPHTGGGGGHIGGGGGHMGGGGGHAGGGGGGHAGGGHR